MELQRLHAAGVDADGEVGDQDPLKAIADILKRQQFDEIILSTLPQGRSRWLRQDLPSKIGKRFQIPLTHIATPLRTGDLLRCRGSWPSAARLAEPPRRLSRACTARKRRRCARPRTPACVEALFAGRDVATVRAASPGRGGSHSSPNLPPGSRGSGSIGAPRRRTGRPDSVAGAGAAARRPSGEPPPLPKRLNASGSGRLALAAVVVVVWVVLAAVRPAARRSIWPTARCCG